MSLNTRLFESINIVSAFPAGTDVNTDIDGDWVSLKNYDGCLIYLKKAAGTAGDDITITLAQATAVAGTGSKALTFNHVYARVGATALTGAGTWTKYSGTALSTLDTVTAFGTDLLSDVGEAQFLIDVRASDLDVTNGFDCLKVTSEGDDVANATLTSGDYILYNARYPGASPLSAIVD